MPVERSINVGVFLELFLYPQKLHGLALEMNSLHGSACAREAYV